MQSKLNGIASATTTSPSLPLRTGRASARVVRPREPRQRERAEQQSEVAQRDVVEPGDGEQVDDDSRQPGHDHRGAVARLDCHEEALQDLDSADEVHESWPGPGAMSLIHGAR